MSEPEMDSGSFNKNYRILKETADWLSKQEEPDIDQLVPKVERAMQAYRICKDRLDRVKETLGQYLQGDAPPAGDGAPEAGGDGSLTRSRVPSPGRDGEGPELPF
jgi:exodeoxyribonuclease VII small subunit